MISYDIYCSYKTLFLSVASLELAWMETTWSLWLFALLYFEFHDDVLQKSAGMLSFRSRGCEPDMYAQLTWH